jgi:hypothetical protein
MVLRYVATPQSGRSPKGQPRNLPDNVQPMRTAPTGAAEIVTKDAQGNLKTKWGVFRRDSWRELQPYKNFYSGGWDWRENGFKISQPLGWLPRRGR